MFAWDYYIDIQATPISNWDDIAGEMIIFGCSKGLHTFNFYGLRNVGNAIVLFVVSVPLGEVTKLKFPLD